MARKSSPFRIPSMMLGVGLTVENDEFAGFYIGRSNDLSATKARHQCDRIDRLESFGTAEEAVEVEGELIKEFYPHAKNWNESPGAGGGVGEDGPHFVYLALWHTEAHRRVIGLLSP